MRVVGASSDRFFLRGSSAGFSSSPESAAVSGFSSTELSSALGASSVVAPSDSLVDELGRRRVSPVRRVGRRDSLPSKNGGPDTQSHRQSADSSYAFPRCHAYLLTVGASHRCTRLWLESPIISRHCEPGSVNSC